MYGFEVTKNAKRCKIERFTKSSLGLWISFDFGGKIIISIKKQSYKIQAALKKTKCPFIQYTINKHTQFETNIFFNCALAKNQVKVMTSFFNAIFGISNCRKQK